MSKFKKLLAYSKKVFLFNQFLGEFNERRRYKQSKDSYVLFSIISGLMSGLKSLNELSQGSPAKYSRSVLEDFLNIEGLPRKLRRYMASIHKRMRRGKMINLEHVKGKVIASVDGIETHRRRYAVKNFYKAVAAGLIDSHCQIAIHLNKETGEIESYEVYQRLVVLCIITDRGPMPLAWAYQQSEAGEQFKTWLDSGRPTEGLPTTNKDSIEKIKQQGEITTLKKLLKDLQEDFPRGMPFDVLVGDGLYDKSTILEEVEKYGVALVAVQKDENRKLRQEAAEDFSTQKPSILWEETAKSYEGWAGIYEDKNILRLNKLVKIVRVIRSTKKGSIDNYFYCSDRSFITPRFVEWCRHYRWKEENGFNAWTNKWKLLKHTFHHSFASAESMVGMIFMSIIFVENFRKGNLKRGKHKGKLKQSLELFFREIIQGINFKTRDGFLIFYEGFLEIKALPS